MLDAGAGFGRHAFGLALHGCNVVALDFADEVVGTRATFGGMIDAGQIHPDRYVGVLRAVTPPACRSATALSTG